MIPFFTLTELQPDSTEVVTWAKILKVSSQAELRSDSDLTQLSVFSLKPYPSANLHLIVVAYFGGPCYFVVTGDAAAFTWPQCNFFWRTYQNESRRGKWIYQWFLIFSSPVRFTSWIMLNVGSPSLTPWNFKRSLSTPEFSLTCSSCVQVLERQLVKSLLELQYFLCKNSGKIGKYPTTIFDVIRNLHHKIMHKWTEHTKEISVEVPLKPFEFMQKPRPKFIQ